MQAPRGGLKQPLIEDGIDHHEPADISGTTLADWSPMNGAVWLAPFIRLEREKGRPKPSFFQFGLVLVLTFLSAYMYGWAVLSFMNNVFGATTAAATTPPAVSPTSGADRAISSFLIALVSGMAYYLIKLWTSDWELRTYVFPEIAVASTDPRSQGFIISGILAGTLYGGYAAAGATIKHLYGGHAAPEIINGASASVGTTTTVFVMYTFAVSFVIFNYIYNMYFYNRKPTGRTSDNDRRETYYESARRAVLATTIALVIVTVLFAGYNMKNFSSGLYVAAIMATGIKRQWAISTFLPLFLSTIFALLAYVVIRLIKQLENGPWGEKLKFSASQVESGYVSAPVQSETVRRRVNVNY